MTEFCQSKAALPPMLFRSAHPWKRDPLFHILAQAPDDGLLRCVGRSRPKSAPSKPSLNMPETSELKAPMRRWLGPER